MASNRIISGCVHPLFVTALCCAILVAEGARVERLLLEEHENIPTLAPTERHSSGAEEDRHYHQLSVRRSFYFESHGRDDLREWPAVIVKGAQYIKIDFNFRSNPAECMMQTRLPPSPTDYSEGCFVLCHYYSNKTTDFNTTDDIVQFVNDTANDYLLDGTSYGNIVFQMCLKREPGFHHLDDPASYGAKWVKLMKQFYDLIQPILLSRSNRRSVQFVFDDYPYGNIELYSNFPGWNSTWTGETFLSAENNSVALGNNVFQMVNMGFQSSAWAELAAGKFYKFAHPNYAFIGWEPGSQGAISEFHQMFLGFNFTNPLGTIIAFNQDPELFHTYSANCTRRFSHVPFGSTDMSHSAVSSFSVASGGTAKSHNVSSTGRETSTTTITAPVTDFVVVVALSEQGVSSQIDTEDGSTNGTTSITMELTVLQRQRQGTFVPLKTVSVPFGLQGNISSTTATLQDSECLKYTGPTTTAAKTASTTEEQQEQEEQRQEVCFYNIRVWVFNELGDMQSFGLELLHREGDGELFQWVDWWLSTNYTPTGTVGDGDDGISTIAGDKKSSSPSPAVPLTVATACVEGASLESEEVRVTPFLTVSIVDDDHDHRQHHEKEQQAVLVLHGWYELTTFSSSNRSTGGNHSHHRYASFTSAPLVVATGLPSSASASSTIQGLSLAALVVSSNGAGETDEGSGNHSVTVSSTWSSNRSVSAVFVEVVLDVVVATPTSITVSIQQLSDVIPPVGTPPAKLGVGEYPTVALFPSHYQGASVGTVPGPKSDRGSNHQHHSTAATTTTTTDNTTTRSGPLALISYGESFCYNNMMIDDDIDPFTGVKVCNLQHDPHFEVVKQPVQSYAYGHTDAFKKLISEQVDDPQLNGYATTCSTEVFQGQFDMGYRSSVVLLPKRPELGDYFLRDGGLLGVATVTSLKEPIVTVCGAPDPLEGHLVLDSFPLMGFFNTSAVFEV